MRLTISIRIVKIDDDPDVGVACGLDFCFVFRTAPSFFEIALFEFEFEFVPELLLINGANCANGNAIGILPK
jgi:hypothetical protein